MRPILDKLRTFLNKSIVISSRNDNYCLPKKNSSTKRYKKYNRMWFNNYKGEEKLISACMNKSMRSTKPSRDLSTIIKRSTNWKLWIYSSSQSTETSLPNWRKSRNKQFKSQNSSLSQHSNNISTPISSWIPKKHFLNILSLNNLRQSHQNA